MKTISSRDNALYKEVKQLATSAAARRKSGLSLLEGIHLAQTWLQRYLVPQYCVLAESAVQHSEVADIVAQCQACGAPCIKMPDALYHGVSQLQNGIGVLLVIAVPQPALPERLTISSALLDQLQDPGNLGSLLRSAAAAGIRHIYCSPGTAAVWSPKVLRAGMGAHFFLEIAENVDLITLCQGSRIPLLATSSHASCTIYQTDLTQEVGWLFGHEGQGVSPELLAIASTQVAIPHQGAMESLNVAAAAAVCFFEQARQRQSHIEGI